MASKVCGWQILCMEKFDERNTKGGISKASPLEAFMASCSLVVNGDE